MLQKEHILFHIDGKEISYMSKYDYELDLTNVNNSRKLVNDCIKKNSLVLEFGPSSGELTKYLNEVKHCIVDIVEIDRVSGELASNYSRNALIGSNNGDIEKYIWEEKFNGLKYDYILFADVLEHLHNPQKVLEHCKNFLKNDGKIILSVPNIANNAIILNLLRNRFEYTNTGLLDSTHIHFFSFFSLEEMISKSGFIPIKRQATYLGVGNNEVDVRYDMFDDIVSNVVKSHLLGDIYQFVYEIIVNSGIHNEHKSVSKFLKDNSITIVNSSLYYDLGLGYEENHIISEQLTVDNEEHFIINFHINSKQQICGLRFDPIENENSILKLISIKIDDKECNVSCKTNCDFFINGLYVFLHGDPQIEFKTNFKDCSKITVEGNMYIGKNYYEMLFKQMEALRNNFVELQNDNLRLQNHLDTIQQSLFWKITLPIRKILNID